ncbi:MAG TPA: protein kinase [Polyangiaceae bacterium]|nr:protein kinase [Polyangiaceae bacterium]
MSLSLLPGHELGRYELLVPVARGGMAQLWAARLRGTRGFQKIVALKTLLPEVLENAAMERMFLEEATLAAQIHHPNVVQTIELGEHENTLFLAMEWVHGEPLTVVMQQAAAHGGIALPIAVNLMAQACRGLHAAHEQRDETGKPLGLVHRDVTPHNLLVAYSGTLKLVDFGVAKATARLAAHTQAGEVKGKLAYMAPEQVANRPLDRRADIFGLGIVSYLLTTGHHPFRGENPGATVRNICAPTPPTRPSELVADYPPELEAAVMKALAKAPEERWPSAQDLLTALSVALPDATETSFDERVSEWMGELLGSRASDRTAQIRLAQQLADRGGLPGSQPGQGSGGSFRAVSMDAQRTESTREPPVDPVRSEPEVTESFFAEERRRRKLLAAGAFIGLTATIAAVASRGTPTGAPLPSGPTLAARRIPSTPRATEQRAVASADSEMPLAIAPASSATALAVSPPEPGVARPAPVALEALSKDNAKPRLLRPIAKTAPKPMASEEAANDTQKAELRVERPPESAVRRIDPWNADTFGGRR